MIELSFPVLLSKMLFGKFAFKGKEFFNKFPFSL